MLGARETTHVKEDPEDGNWEDIRDFEEEEDRIVVGWRYGYRGGKMEGDDFRNIYLCYMTGLI